jgi:hypothetical protein
MVRDIILIIHILAGFSALFSGVGSFATRKGSKQHKAFGKIFFIGMTVVFITTILLILIKPNTFLLLIGIFSFYFAFSGIRVVQKQFPGMPDWGMAIAAALAALLMLILGFRQILENNDFGIVLTVFGIIGIFTAGLDIFRFRKKTQLNRVQTHANRMAGAFTAATTAFSVTNFGFLPALVAWLWPSVLIVPFMYILMSKQRKIAT